MPLKRDRVPTYLVAEWDAVCTMWDGDAISGPVPTLYADNIKVAKRAIMADPAKVHQVFKLRKTELMNSSPNTLLTWTSIHNGI